MVWRAVCDMKRHLDRGSVCGLNGRANELLNRILIQIRAISPDLPHPDVDLVDWRVGRTTWDEWHGLARNQEDAPHGQSRPVGKQAHAGRSSCSSEDGQNVI